MHLRCERGTLHVPKPKLNGNIYNQRFFTSLWEQQIDRVRKQIFLFIRALSKCIDSKWEYEDSETVFVFDGDVRSLLHHLFEHCGYLASHFLGTYAFFEGVPSSFVNATIGAWVDAELTESWMVPAPSLNRFIYEELSCAIMGSCDTPTWQSRDHLMFEYMSAFFTFDCIWNEHGDEDIKALAKYTAFTNRLKLEMDDIE